MTAPLRIITNDRSALASLRDLFSRHPSTQDWPTHELAAVLGVSEAAVQAAREALAVEGEVLA